MYITALPFHLKLDSLGMPELYVAPAASPGAALLASHPSTAITVWSREAKPLSVTGLLENGR